MDRIADFLTILRNATRIAKRSVSTPHSRMREAIAKILKEEGFIRGYDVDRTDEVKPLLIVQLKYMNGESVIHELKRVSKPGRRQYSKMKNLQPVIGGLGISILSTNAGVITDKQAKKLAVSGEVLCQVW